MSDTDVDQSATDPDVRRRARFSLALIVLGVMAVITGVLIMVFGHTFGLAWSCLIGLSCALAVPHLVRYVQRGYLALKADLSDDAVFRSQVTSVRRMRLVAVALLLLVSFAFGGAQFARTFEPAKFNQYREAVEQLDQSRKEFDAERQPGAYEAYVREAEAAGISQDEFDAMEFGADKQALAKSIVNPLASGGIVFWGAFFCGCFLLGGLEVASLSFGLGGYIGELGDEIKRQQEAGEGPRVSEPPVPEDIAQLVERVGNSRAAHVRSFWDFDLKGAGRTDAMGKVLQSVGLSHVRLGGIMFVVFAVWVAASLVLVTQGLVE